MVTGILRILSPWLQTLFLVQQPIYNSISPVEKLCYGISLDELLSKSIYRHGIVSLIYTSIYSYIPGYAVIYMYTSIYWNIPVSFEYISQYI